MNEKKTAEEYPYTSLEKQAVNYVANDDLAMFADNDTRMIYEHYYIKGAEYAAQETAALREQNEQLKEAVKELIEIADEYVTIYEVRERNAYPHYKNEYKRCQEKIENAKK